LICPDTPPLRSNPVFGYLFEGFTKPVPFRVDVAVNIDPVMALKWAMLHEHPSQRRPSHFLGAVDGQESPKLCSAHAKFQSPSTSRAQTVAFLQECLDHRPIYEFRHFTPACHIKNAPEAPTPASVSAESPIKAATLAENSFRPSAVLHWGYFKR
jgi:hypothetical protein